MKNLLRYTLIILIILTTAACGRKQLDLTPNEIDGWIHKLETSTSTSEQKDMCLRYKRSNIELSPVNLQRINVVCSRTDIGVSVIKTEVKR